MNSRQAVGLAWGIAIVVAVGCSEDGTAPVSTPDDAAALRTAAIAAGLAPLPDAPPYPIDNPYVPARVSLGHTLFFDAILSGPKDVACSTCHLPRAGFGDERQFAVGAGATGLGRDRTLPQPPPLRTMPRNSLATVNVGMYGRMSPEPSANATIFWGASAFGLEAQVLNPISADNELRGLTYSAAVARDSVLARLRDIPEYVALFAEAFPDLAGQSLDEQVSTSTLRRALAAYLRELRTPHAPLDEFLRGNDDALTPAQQEGLALFIGKAGCVTCHTGPTLSDFRPHVIGAAQEGIGRDTTPGDDLGWGEVGGVPYAFRTPSLRQVVLTAPYLHAGSADSLLDVLRFKNAGRSANPRVADAALDPAVHPLGLTDEELDRLLAFLDALTDRVSIEDPLMLAPASVPSGLTIPK